MFELSDEAAKRMSGEAIIDEREEIAEFLSKEFDYDRCTWDDVTERACLVTVEDVRNGDENEDVCVISTIDIPKDKPCAVYVTFENEWKGFIFSRFCEEQWDVDNFEAQDSIGAITYNHPTQGAITLEQGDNMEFQNNVRHEAVLFFNVNPEKEASFASDAFFDKPFFNEEVLAQIA